MQLSYLKKSSRVFVLLFFSLVFLVKIYAQEKQEFKNSKVSGYIDFNGYYDTREFSVFTYNILANLPKRFQYFSLTNYESSNSSSGLSKNYAEHNLRWGIGEAIPLDLTLQYVLRNGENNNDVRLGFRWKVNQTKGIQKMFNKLNMSYSLNPMLLQFRLHNKTTYMTQIEHVYSILLLPKICNKRLYLGGFADQNFIYNNGGVSFKWVSEHQLGYRILNRLYVVLEYRINDYYQNDTYGLGYGLEYKISF